MFDFLLVVENIVEFFIFADDQVGGFFVDWQEFGGKVFDFGDGGFFTGPDSISYILGLRDQDDEVVIVFIDEFEGIFFQHGLG